MSVDPSYWIKCRTKTLPLLRADSEGSQIYTVYRWTKWHPVKQCQTFAQAVKEFDYLENEPGLPTEVAARPPIEYAVWKAGRKIYP